MHLVNFEPLLAHWWIVAMLLAGVAMISLGAAWFARRPDREYAAREKQYWDQEYQWRSRTETGRYDSRRAPDHAREND